MLMMIIPIECGNDHSIHHHQQQLLIIAIGDDGQSPSNLTRPLNNQSINHT